MIEKKIREIMRQRSGRRSIGACPVCKNTPLQSIKVEGTEQDFCDSCHGIWLDSGEATEIAEGVKDFPDFEWSWSRRKASVKLSPKHPGESMWELPYAEGENLKVDFCETSRGIWLDGSEIAELERIVADRTDPDQRLHKMMGNMIRDGYICLS